MNSGAAMMPMPWPRPGPDRVPKLRTARSSPTAKRMRRSRMLGWDRNPLRRRIDRVEAAVVAGLIAVFLISAPVLGAAAGHWSDSAGMREQRAEMAWRLVPATVQGNAQRQIPSGPAGTVWMMARWTAPDGQARRGWISVTPGDAAGGSVRVWVTPSGSLTWPPLRHSQVQAHIALAEWLTALVLGLLLCLAVGMERVLFARRRLADWNRAWREIEPQWTRQR
jgi:hypothetical protein